MKQNSEPRPPLVSVVVITYNQQGCVVETLDSIARQSWPEVEIVVADDRSTDRTLDVVREWGRAHPDVRLTVVASEVNTGISANLNRGVRASRGGWIKPIAGDDLLVPRAVERYMDYCTTHRVEACVSRLEFFGTDSALIEFKKKHYERFHRYYKTRTLPQRQRLILRECLIPMPGMFMSRALWDIIGGIDERFPFGEEWPTYISILERGYDLPMFDDRLVRYRCSGGTMGASTGTLMDRRVFDDQIRTYRMLRRPRLLARRMYCDVFDQEIVYFASGLLYRPTHRRFWRTVRWALIHANPMTYINRVRHAK